ncbi:MAG TPA: thiol-activated cytolysin family protein [Chitinophagales bacterium]|nr:thiol-activated cytolysin family protein [Chitinophagales bacterium]
MTKKSLLTILFAFAVLCITCKKDKNLSTELPSDLLDSLNNDFNDSVNLSKHIPQINIVDPPIPIADPIDTIIYGTNCTVQKYHWAPGYEDPLLLDPTSDVIFPGAILGAESITEGSYALITGDRGPITLSISLSNIIGNISATASEATLSKVREAIQDILDAEVQGNIPAVLAYDIIQIHSDEQFKVAIGANLDVPFGSISAAFNFNSQEQKSRYVIKFYQVYYTLDIDVPEKPSDFWNTPPSAQTLGEYTPVYVSSIKYGRSVLCMFESSSSAEDLYAALSASYGGLFVSGELDASLEQQEILNSSHMSLLIVGGDATQAVQVTNFDSLNSYIVDGGNWSNNSPAAPLAYTLRFLDNNEVARVILSSEYNVQTCEVITPPDSGTISYLNPNSEIKLCPVKLGNGDKEFDGHGPDISVSVTLEIRNNGKELWRVVEFDAIETQSDYTHAVQDPDWEEVKIFTAPSGKKIKQINSDKSTSYDYEDTDHEEDVKEFSSSELIDKFKIKGDTNGDDVGNCTDDDVYLSIYYNTIELVLVDQ